MNFYTMELYRKSGNLKGQLCGTIGGVYATPTEAFEKIKAYIDFNDYEFDGITVLPMDNLFTKAALSGGVMNMFMLTDYKRE